MSVAAGSRFREESAGLLARWLGTAALRSTTFRKIAGDPRALVQAAVVVLAGGIGRGIGAFADEGWLGLAGGTAVGVVMWIVATALVWGIGVHGFRLAAEFPELLRALGFAAAPFVGLAVCAVLPPSAGRVAAALVHAWATLAFAVAARAALGVSALRALWICAAALGSALALLLGAAAFLFDAMFID